jgi:hypothetical protein
MAPRTAQDFSDAVTRELTWRIKEISVLKLSSAGMDTVAQAALFRSLVPLSYAHWEGFVKSSVRLYLDYVAARRLQFRELCLPLRANRIHSYAVLSGSRRLTVRELIEIARLFEAVPEQRFAQYVEELYSLRSNLNSAVLGDICTLIDMPEGIFTEEDLKFIDEILLNRRNNIAHGAHISVTRTEIDEISVKVIEIMRKFKDELENSVVLSRYRR